MNSEIQALYGKIIFFIIIIFFTNILNSQTTFVESQNITSTFPSSAELIDLDGDNDLDLVRTLDRATGLNDLNANEIWLNDGTGNFTLHQSFGNSESKGMAIGDLDGDNDNDIFIANATYFIGQSSISSNKVWLNDGAGNFTNSGQSLGVRRSLAVTLADLDGDNDLDAYVANSGDNDNPNTVWINNGEGQFTDSGQLLGSSETQDVASADIDNDNDIDIITANCCSNTSNANRVWINNGFGTFTNTQEIGIFSSENLSVADLDGDLDFDIVFSNTFEASKTYTNNGNGNFSFHSNVISFPIAQKKTIKFSDIDNDGDNDLIVGVFSDLYENRILINDGLGNFTENFQFIISNTWDIAIGDIDNDGDKDVFMLNINNQNNRFWLNQKTLGLDENIKSFIKIYPNPVQGDLIISLDKMYSNIEVNLFNLLYQKIYTQNFERTKMIRLPLEGPKGIYFIEIKADQNKYRVHKLIKQ